MRRAILIAVSLIFMFGVAAAVFFAYSNHEETVELEDIAFDSKTITSDGYFEAEVTCDLKGKFISGYDYEIENNKLYITVLIATSEKKALPKNDEGASIIRFEVGNNIEKIYYRGKNDDSNLNFAKS